MNDYLTPALGSPWTKKKILEMLIAAPCLSLLSFLLLGTDLVATEVNPGGNFLEVSFWLTGFGTAFLSFVMLEILFRSRETRLLAPWPVDPLRLYLYHFRRIARGIALSTLLYAFFWLPQMLAEAQIAVWCVLLWPVSLLICSAISSAIIIYTGNAGTREENRGAQFGVNAFSVAPAIGLAVSLMTTLLLKLLVEALLKPGFFNAAMTAVSIAAGIFAVSLIYSCITYKRRYYAILAGFIDTDLIVLNAGYDFIDGKKAGELRKASSTKDALVMSLVMQYRRCHPMVPVFIGICAVILALVLGYKPEFLSLVYVPLLAQLPWVLFARPWAAFSSTELNPGVLDTLAVERNLVEKSIVSAVVRLMPAQGVILSLAVAIPFALHKGIGFAVISAFSTFALCAFLTYICAVVSLKRRRQLEV